jgi:hypothetical protein
VGVDDELALVIKLELKRMKSADRVANFMQDTGKSQNTYYRRRIEAKANTPGGDTNLAPPKHKLPKPKGLPKLVNAPPVHQVIPSFAERAEILLGLVDQFTATKGEKAKLIKMLGQANKAKKAAKAKKTKGKTDKKKT